MSYEKFNSVRKASRQLALLDAAIINRILFELAEEAEKETAFLLSENTKDLGLMNPDDPKYDRLLLTKERIKSISDDIRNVAKLDYPVGKTLLERTLPNGLRIKKITVPLGVIGIIYESRPNVTFDVFTLCLKSGNACILKGSKDAQHSNEAIVSIIHRVLQRNHVSADTVFLLPPDREATEMMLHAAGYVDIVIPRGSQSLINFVRQNAKMPVIETGAGIVHTYFDESADLNKGKAIIDNAKTRRVSVCNALDCLIIHKKRLGELPALTEPLGKKGVEIFADQPSYQALEGYYPAALLHHADATSFGTEFLSLKMAIKTVDALDEALEHIERYSSKHSEAIIAEDKAAIDKFLKSVDAAAVYANTSTAFTDGAQFGLGAEIGISTQKLHARGPMALEELTSYKWIIVGEGHVRVP
ncbi:MAG TPA: glutamate-5-semialdehyde dehydrogenase [Chitinophagales bacterium]|nr:glutamate-5-semialdehyde dehydrogenase [Chitinophagales bacterium]